MRCCDVCLGASGGGGVPVLNVGTDRFDCIKFNYKSWDRTERCNVLVELVEEEYSTGHLGQIDLMVHVRHGIECADTVLVVCVAIV